MIRFMLKLSGRYLALIVSLGVIWLLLSGFYHDGTLLLFGLISVLVTAWLSVRAGMADSEGVPTHIFPGILGYMVWLTVEIGKANFIVLRHAFSPKITISPKMVKIPAVQSSDLGKVIFANSITLTPGTVSVDLYENCILVHGLTEELAAPEGMIDMGDRVCALDGDGALKVAAAQSKEREAK